MGQAQHTVDLRGGRVITVSQVVPDEYHPNKGVFLAQLLGKPRGDAFGLYHGKIEPNCQISREIHDTVSETLYILSGEAVGLVGDREVALRAGQVLHVDRSTPHGLRNVGKTTLEFLVIGNPDF
jgi:mannose-6-phosphate isomerase-like protein (cupin superfamily)